MRVSSLIRIIGSCLLLSVQCFYVHAAEVTVPESIPGESIANRNIVFMSRFHELLVDYSQRTHQCNRPFVFDSKIVHFNKLDNTTEPPVLTGPIHEQWKVSACGKKFLFYLGIAPSEENQQDLLIATLAQEVDW